VQGTVEHANRAGASMAWRDPIQAAVMLLVAVLLTGCTLGEIFTERSQPPQVDAELPQVSPTAAKVALVLPLTGQGETQRIGVALKQAAELAMFDATDPEIELITKDTGGTPEGAAAAATAALAEGAEIILGPLLASEVQAVSAVARRGNVPVVAFSTISSVAGPGVYLLSFLPEEEVAQVVRYAVDNDGRRIAALLPESPFGTTVERALTASAKVYGARLVVVERYAPTSQALGDAAVRIAGAARDGSVEAVMIPDGGEALRQAGFALQQAGFSPGQARVLGTGAWDDARIGTIPIAVGGWFAGVPSEILRRFQDRYRQAYFSQPPRIASLAYDAVSLAIILGRDSSPQRFSAAKFTDPEGFQGINGLFRFRPNGLVERGLAILEVTPTGPRVIAPAPDRFGAGF
jgi:branched-chain amino acid transport system substrate-binding protein